MCSTQQRGIFKLTSSLSGPYLGEGEGETEALEEVAGAEQAPIEPVCITSARLVAKTPVMLLPALLCRQWVMLGECRSEPLSFVALAGGTALTSFTGSCRPGETPGSLEVAWEQDNDSPVR